MPKFVVDKDGFIMSAETYKNWEVKPTRSGTQTVARNKLKATVTPSQKKVPKAVTPKPEVPSVIRPSAPCTVCGVNVRLDRIQKHMDKVHASPPVSPASNKNPAKNIRKVDTVFVATTTGWRRKEALRGSVVSSQAPGWESDRSLSDTEPSDGGRNLGYLSREYGSQYGSLPGYDDYSDESSAD